MCNDELDNKNHRVYKLSNFESFKGEQKIDEKIFIKDKTGLLTHQNKKNDLIVTFRSFRKFFNCLFGTDK